MARVGAHSSLFGQLRSHMPDICANCAFLAKEPCFLVYMELKSVDVVVRVSFFFYSLLSITVRGGVGKIGRDGDSLRLLAAPISTSERGSRPRNAQKHLRRHGKRLGERRLRDIQPPYVRQLMEHGRLPAGCPKVFFVAAICVPQMRGSVRGGQCLERGKTYVGNGKNQRWKIRKPTLEIPVS